MTQETYEQKKARLFAEVEALNPGYIKNMQQVKAERETRALASRQRIATAAAAAEVELARLEACEANQAAFLAKLAGTYTRGAMTPRIEVADMVVESVEANERTGRDVAYTDEDGVQHTARSGKWLQQL